MGHIAEHLLLSGMGCQGKEDESVRRLITQIPHIQNVVRYQSGFMKIAGLRENFFSGFLPAIGTRQSVFQSDQSSGRIPQSDEFRLWRRDIESLFFRDVIVEEDSPQAIGKFRG
jgi:hypothetical protein